MKLNKKFNYYSNKYFDNIKKYFFNDYIEKGICQINSHLIFQINFFVY